MYVWGESVLFSAPQVRYLSYGISILARLVRSAAAQDCLLFLHSAFSPTCRPLPSPRSLRVSSFHHSPLPTFWQIFDNDPRLVSLDQEMADRPDDAASLSAAEASDDDEERLGRDVEAALGMELQETKSAAASSKGFKQV